MSDEQVLTKLVDRLRPLWLFLTGSAFVSFAGTALTLLYFWGIGGVPIGQVAGAGSMAKVVLSSACLFAILFLMAWLAPTILSQFVTDESPFALRLRRLFSKSADDVESKKGKPSSGDVLQGAPSGHTELIPLVAEAPATEQMGTSGHGAVSWRRIFAFSLFTVGVGCVGLILLALGAGREKGSDSVWLTLLYCLVLPALFIGVLLAVMWRRFNRMPGDAGNVIEGGMSTPKKDRDWFVWALFGYGSAVLSLLPLLTLLLVFIRTEFLLEQDSYLVFVLGASLMSLGIVVAYSVSLAVLVRRRQGIAVRWAVVLGVNAMVLFGVVMTLGLTTRILEAVMVMSSVRVESAVLLLEPEGCDLLQSMGAEGWGRLEGSSDKTCLLYDVTIQSTLEPAMQLACWRGVVSKSDPVAAKPEARASASAPSASAAASSASAPVPASAASSVNAAAVVPPPLAASQTPVQEAVILGRKGSFTIPTKFVRSVWKTGGVRLEGQPPVCPLALKIRKGAMPATASSAPASAAASAASAVAASASAAASSSTK